MGRMIRGLAAEGNLRVLAADTTDICQEAQHRHHLSHTATAALGRAMTGGLLLAALLSKTPRERVDLRFEGDGPAGALMVDASPDGSVRGYLRHPQAELPLRSDGKLDVGGLIGQGELKVMRSLSNGEIYQSSTRLVSGEIAEDLAHYLWQSEQIPSALLLGVRLEAKGTVRHSGGVVVQVTPGCPDQVIAQLEANLAGVKGLTDLLEAHGLEGTVEHLLRGMDYQATDLSVIGFKQGHIPLQFRCRCSRTKALDSLAFFDPHERQAMIDEDGGAEVCCDWCNQKYQITPEEILSLEVGQVAANPQA